MLASGALGDAATAWRSALFPETWNPPAASASFDSDKLIQDFSYAGYRRGEDELPVVPGPVFDAVAFGADPSGAGDSTAAIQAAINAAGAAGGGVVSLPAGLFLVQPPAGAGHCLRIATSHIVLRGAGPAETFLLNTSYQMRNRAVIRAGPASTTSGSAVEVTADLAGPTRRLPVANPAAFVAGQFVRLEWSFISPRLGWMHRRRDAIVWAVHRHAAAPPTNHHTPAPGSPAALALVLPGRLLHLGKRGRRHAGNP